MHSASCNRSRYDAPRMTARPTPTRNTANGRHVARNVGKNVAIVACAYILSNLAGFGARLLVRARFPSAQTDAFWSAFEIPDTLFMLLAGGALASAFIPAYTARLANDEHALAWALAKRVAGIVFLVVLGFALLAALFALPLVRTIVAPGFAPDKAALTAALMRIMLISTVIFSVSGLLMGLLQSNGSFLAPALAPALYQLGLVFGATALAGWGIHGVAAGAVVGAVLHLGVQLPALRRLVISNWGLVISHQTQITNYQLPITSDLHQILRAMPQRMLGLGAVRINKLVTAYLASGMGQGAVSALSDGWAIMVLPQAVIGQAIGTVLFPAISAHAAKGERVQFAAALTRALNVIITLSLPAAVGLAMLSRPLIALLFQRGQFTSTQTQQVAWALAWFAAGLLAHATLELITRAFYAVKDSRTPAWLSAASTALNIPLGIGLAALFGSMGLLPFGGLALALSIATALETLALFVVLARRTPELRVHSIVLELGKSVIASAIMALGIWVWLAVRGDGPVWALLAIGLGAFVYFDAMWLLKSDAAGYVMAWVATLRGKSQRHTD